MARSSLAIIIPAYNEQETIGNILACVLEYGHPIVIDDNSTDNTGTIARKSGATVVTHIKNCGYDDALNSGFEKAYKLSYDYAITFDADGQHDHRDLKIVKDKLINGYEMVIGIRPQKARLAERAFSWYTKLIYDISDPLCGLKGYCMEIYKKRGVFDKRNSIGTELALYAKRNKFKTIELPIRIVERKGKSRFGSVVSGNYRIFRALILSLLSNN